jgi:TolA-binding protein
MKKFLLSFMILVLSISFVLAATSVGLGAGAGISDNGNGSEDIQIQIMAQQGSNSIAGYGNTTHEQKREMFEQGQEIRLQVMEQNQEQSREVRLERIQNKVQLKAGNQSVNCSGECEFNQIGNKSRIMQELSNGRNAEIKIMPDSASERALEALRLHVCSEENNCTIELKEVSIKGGEKGNVSLAYELKRERRAKVLGFIGAKMDVKAQVNAETGEIIRLRKPWWAFLASEPEEELEQ